MTNNRNSSQTWLLVLAGVGIFVLCLGILLILTAGNIFIVIAPDERGIVLSMNEPTGKILEPGQHFILPSQRVVVFNIGSQTYTMSANATIGDDAVRGKTSDGQEIEVDISVIYAVDPEQVLDLYKNWQDRYRDGVVRPMSRGITRDTLGQYTFYEIVEKQEEIEEIVSDQLKTPLTENYLILVEYNLLDVRQANP